MTGNWYWTTSGWQSQSFAEAYEAQQDLMQHVGYETECFPGLVFKERVNRMNKGAAA